jgi:hypothetical protein
MLAAVNGVAIKIPSCGEFDDKKLRESSQTSMRTASGYTLVNKILVVVATSATAVSWITDGEVIRITVSVGDREGETVGENDGDTVGLVVGASEGRDVVGDREGVCEGVLDGD